MRPKSFSHIIQTNLQGAATLDACPIDKSLTPKQFEEMMADGAVIIDARDSAAFGGFHIPSSINIGFEKQLANCIELKGSFTAVCCKHDAQQHQTRAKIKNCQTPVKRI